MRSVIDEAWGADRPKTVGVAGLDRFHNVYCDETFMLSRRMGGASASAVN